MKSIRSNLVFLVMISFFLSSNSVFAAAPNIWWDHLNPQKIELSACVNKADATLSGATSKYRKKESDRVKVGDDSVRFRNREMQVVIECLKLDEEIQVFLLVGTDNISRGNEVFEEIKKGMKD